MKKMEIKPIARFCSPFSSKFGIPKQAGLVSELEGRLFSNPSIAMPMPCGVWMASTICG